MAKITVITASYNHAQYISETIESVLNQSFDDFAYFILDDGSKDNSKEIIQKYAKKDSRIVFLQHENNANMGLAATIEKCVQMTQTPYIAFLESDDIWQKDFLSELYSLAQKNPNTGLFYCSIEPFGTQDKRNTSHEKMQKRREKLIAKKNLDRFDIWLRLPILTFSSVMAKRDLLKSCTFDREEKVLSFLDVFLWNQCFIKAPALYYKKNLTLWRKHELSYSCRKDIPAYFVEDMAFDVLYPEAKAEDKVFYKKVFESKLAKYFHSQVKLFLKLYFTAKYGKKKISIDIKK